VIFNDLTDAGLMLGGKKQAQQEDNRKGRQGKKGQGRKAQQADDDG